MTLNARDAMPHGGALTIEATNVTLDNTYARQHEEIEPGEYVKVAVSDSGIRRTPEIIGKVFEPFFTTKEVGQGSGLGLSMVFGFAKQSNGHMQITSKEGVGTTVSLYFPITESKSVEANDNTALIPNEHTVKNILLVEDDQQVRATTSATLNEMDYNVIEAADGPSALENTKPNTRRH